MTPRQTQDATIDAVDRVCHELRRPLAIVHSFAELLRDEVSGTLNPNQQEHVQSILRGARNLDRCVRALHDLAEIESSRLRLVPEACDLHAVAGDLHTEYAARFEGAGIGFGVALGDQPPVLSADSGRVRRALAHLLDNALQFVPAGGEVVLRVEALADGARVEVADDGPGVPAAERERIFEPFYRLPVRGGAAVDGMGLGLALCHAYALAHGGRVEALPSTQDGLVVRLELPREPAPALSADLSNKQETTP